MTEKTEAVGLTTSLRGRSRRLCAALLVTALGLTALAGCGDDSAADKDGKKARVAWLAHGYDELMQAYRAGIDDEIKPGGGSVTVFNSGFDAQKLLANCKSAVTSGRYDVIVLTPPQPSFGVSCAKQAERADIPVVAMSIPVGEDGNKIEPQVPGVVGSVVNGEESFANVNFAAVKKACEGINPCEVLQEIFAAGSPANAAFKAQVERESGIKVVQQVATNADPAEVGKILPAALARNSGADVLMSINATQAVAAAPAIERAGLTDQIKVLAAGGSWTDREALASGKVDVLMLYFPRTVGRLTGKMILQALAGEKVTPNAIEEATVHEPAIVDRSQLESFKPEYGKQDAQ